MGFFVGIDIGSVSAKLAALGQPSTPTVPTPSLQMPHSFFPVDFSVERRLAAPLFLSHYRRTFGNPAQTVRDLLSEFRAAFPGEQILGIRVTGSGGRLLATALDAIAENEFKAIACAMGQLHPEVRTVFEIGGESSKYLRLTTDRPQDASTGSNANTFATGIADYSTSGECAAGTGSFLDQQATRLKYRVEEIGSIVAGARCAARIAGRCSVFAKSDMIHAQQKGYSTDEVLKGLCEAVARNFKSNIVRGKPVTERVALIGAVAQNSGLVQALAELFRLRANELYVPDEYAWVGAIGCALLQRAAVAAPSLKKHSTVHTWQQSANTSEPNNGVAPLSLANVLLLRDHPDAARTASLPREGESISTYLGIDIGSVSTNLALLDEHGNLLHGIYLRTAGRPIEVVQEGLQEIVGVFGDRIIVRGVGTTGSGRELIGELVGADTINDEITAHKTGALFVHQKLVRDCASSALANGAQPEDIGDVDTIIEIGGQDSKFISIENGVVVDFAMNEACAAGTGSFLEEQAERLGIRIKNEFADNALASRAPARLGERCTVFMERDVTALLQRGASVCDLAAGLAYSVAINYLNRVVRGRKVGNVIYFQGGTAYNDSVAAAFSQILGKRIIVPPHNGIIGAIGMGLIAQQVTQSKELIQHARQPRAMAASAGASTGSITTLAPPDTTISTFRGFDLNRASFQTREFVCKACSNYCDMKEVTVDNRKTYWGDKCSDKFRKRARTDHRPVIADLLAVRDSLLRAGYHPPVNGDGKPRIGIPQAMYFYDRFPFWLTYLEAIDLEVELSSATDQRVASVGAELSIAEPCFPVQIAHGHVHSLLRNTEDHASVDFVFLPNVMDMEAPESPTASLLCPWNQTLPYVVRSAPQFEKFADRILAPTLYFRAGRKHVKHQLAECFARFGVTRRQSDLAADAAFAAQSTFTGRIIEEGNQARATLRATGDPVVLLVGRPYNIYDRSSNCDIPRKLRDLYGVNVLPLDFLPLDDRGGDDLHPNMFWNSGRRILEAGRFARENKNVHMIYLTNFKCGPDSFVKHFLREVSGAPFLVLQFDGHGNDAGYLTRCEAYLDSKGLLR